MEKYPLISVIVPVYNTEKFLKKCLESLINQTYQELEIIVVNDASTDDSNDIIQEYVAADSRVHCVVHKKNMGLFQARITGVQASKGDYIAFVDSDDYVSIDWFRLLVKKAMEERADIVVGEWCFEYETGWREYLNLDPFRIQDLCLCGSEVIDSFMKQEGRCFSWHVVWNKLYKRDLWEQCEADFVNFSRQHGHMLMWEDVAFSSGFLTCAKKVVNVHGGNYFYYKHSSASTSQFSIKNRTRGEKYINDSSSAIEFMEFMLKKRNYLSLYQKQYNNWKLYCKYTLYHDLIENLSSRVYKNSIENRLGHLDKLEYEIEDFYYQNKTKLDTEYDWYEEIKKFICAPDTAIVSFDVFDTLVQRPFLEPTDLFNILSDKFNELLNSSAYIDFKQIRISAENECRKLYALKHPSIEEITLDEIYTYIQKKCCFDSQVINHIKDIEVELELSFCKPRNSGKELFELAQYCNKKIIICSDMYLSEDVIAAILRKNQYANWAKLYVSSETKFTKQSGHMYDYICRDMKIPPRGRKNCIHIGDNWQSDVEMPKKKGWESAHLSKAADLLRGRNPGIYSGEFYQNVMQNSYHLVDTYWAEHDFLGLSCVFGLIGNKIYDNPYISINRGSDFNMNPYTIGYMTLGPHLLALIQWIEKKRQSLDAPTIHFVARDGFLVKKAYDIYYPGNQNSNYIRLSRKSLLLADVNSISDLYSIYIKANITGLSPQKLENYLSPILSQDHLIEVHKKLKENHIIYERKFASIIEYHAALKLYIEYAVNMNQLQTYKRELKKYFSNIFKENDILFDIGYSGRPEAALSNILEFPINSLYIHTLKDIASKRQKRHHCICETFYDYKPVITGVIREHLLMELGPSTIGYKKSGNSLMPVLEEYSENHTVSFVTQILQKAALDFIADYKKTFDDYSKYILARGYDLSLPLEYYLHNSKEMDRRIFSTMKFEDDMGEGKTVNALEFWNNELNQRNQHPSSGAVYGEIIPNMYMDGLFVKFYNYINKTCPYGSKKRELIKRIVRHFLH